MRLRLGAGLVSASALAAIALAMSCRGPTQIRLNISTDVPCSRLRGVAISGGSYGSVERAPPQTITYDCRPDGTIGTLISTPAGDDDGQVAFRVIAGVDKDVTQCTPDDGYAGCSRQLRQLAYLANETAELPIRLYLICVGVACDPSSTCAYTGKCVPATVDPSCRSASCDPTSPAATPDAGKDATTSPDGSSGGGDGSVQDAQTDTGSDGSSSGGDGGGDGGGPGSVVCGPMVCDSPDVCCTAGPTKACKAACDGLEDRFACDSKTDCTGGEYCCDPNPPQAPRDVRCRPLAQCSTVTCRTSADCPPPKMCTVEIVDAPPAAAPPPSGTCQ
ncbi:MAG: hypothetical protein JNL38_07485 [Myxococcales bacterium]|nr:hypothetical protein [Myxococcales bacterium]